MSDSDSTSSAIASGLATGAGFAIGMVVAELIIHRLKARRREANPSRRPRRPASDKVTSSRKGAFPRG